MSQVANPEPRQADDPRSNLSHPDALYEVVDGKVVELPEMGAFSHAIALNLYNCLVAFLAHQRIGRAVHEVVFVLDESRRLSRRPDVAVVSYDRWPADRELPEEGDWPVVPDLAVEVISPNDRTDESLRKVQDYFEHGVQLVWVLLPSMRQVYVYTSVNEVRILREWDELDGGDLLPELRLPVGPLFRRTLA